MYPTYKFTIGLRDNFLHESREAKTVITLESSGQPGCILQVEFDVLDNVPYFDPDFTPRKCGVNKGILACTITDYLTEEKVGGFTVCSSLEEEFEMESYLGLALKRAMSYTKLSPQSRRLMQDALKARIRVERFNTNRLNQRRE